MSGAEAANQFFEVTIDALAQQLCTDCPVKNWIPQIVMQQWDLEVTAENEDAVFDHSDEESLIIQSAFMAAQIKSRLGCAGKQELAHVCEDCGTDGACGALAQAETIFERQRQEDN